MSQFKECAVGDTVYFWFAANTTAGAAGDGATPLFDVRLAGAAASAAPTASGTPTLLTHADYPDGIHEIAVDTTGYAAGEYSVFCTLTISSVNPAGFVGSVKVRAAGETLYERVAAILADTGTDGVLVSAGTGAKQIDVANGIVKANLWQILGTTLTETAGQIAAAFKQFFNVATPTGTVNTVATGAQVKAAAFAQNPIWNMVAMHRIVDMTCDLVLDADAVATIKLLEHDGVTETTLLSWNGGTLVWDRDPGWGVGVEKSGGVLLTITAGASNYAGGSVTIVGTGYNTVEQTYEVTAALVPAAGTMSFTFDSVSGQPQAHPAGQTFAWRDRAVAGDSMGLIEPYASLVTMVGAKTMFAGTYVSMTSSSLGIPDDCEWELGVRTPEGTWDRQVLRHIAGSGGVILQDPNGNLSPVPPGAFCYVVITAGATAVPAGALITLQASNDANMTNRVFAFTPYIAPGASAQGWVRWDGVCYPMDADALGDGTSVRWQIMIDAGTAQESTVNTLQNSVNSVQTDVGAIGTRASQASVDAIAGAVASNAVALAALSSSITTILSTGRAQITLSPAQAVGAETLDTVFTAIRISLRDNNSVQYPDQLMSVFFNRAAEEIAAVLMQIGADIIMGRGSITGDGVNYTFQLPDDFQAFVPSNVRHRSPATATTNYTHGQGISHTDQFNPVFTEAPTVVAPPTSFILVTDGTTQYVRFNTIPKSGDIIDFLYYSAPMSVDFEVGQLNELLGQTYMPWLGLLDPLFKRTIEQYCREGLEFTNEARAAWRARAEADAMMLLGLRHLQARVINPSSWNKLPRR